MNQLWKEADKSCSWIKIVQRRKNVSKLIDDVLTKSQKLAKKYTDNERIRTSATEVIALRMFECYPLTTLARYRAWYDAVVEQPYFRISTMLGLPTVFSTQTSTQPTQKPVV